LRTIIEILALIKFITSHPLNANKKCKSIITFIKWQIGIRLLKKKVISPWVNDSVFICGLSETGLTGNLYTGLIEFEDMAFLLHALQSDEIFVDVGANVGAYTILASKVVGSNSLAFEPLPETANRLKDQIQMNRIEGMVKIHNKGVAEKKGKLFFTNNHDTINKVSLTGNINNTTKTQVDVTTLDDELDNSSKYFIKIDVEGYEYNVIEGASKLLLGNSVSALIVELNGSGKEFGYSDEKVHQKILAFGFNPVSYDPRSRILSACNTYNKKAGNTIYVKDLNYLSKICKKSEFRTIHTSWGVKI
jgi:FkbM family methyltransferase